MLGGDLFFKIEHENEDDIEEATYEQPVNVDGKWGYMTHTNDFKEVDISTATLYYKSKVMDGDLEQAEPTYKIFVGYGENGEDPNKFFVLDGDDYVSLEDDVEYKNIEDTEDAPEQTAVVITGDQLHTDFKKFIGNAVYLYDYTHQG